VLDTGFSNSTSANFGPYAVIETIIRKDAGAREREPT